MATYISITLLMLKNEKLGREVCTPRDGGFLFYILSWPEAQEQGGVREGKRPLILEFGENLG